MEIIQDIGAYAGFAAVVGLAVLAGLYFSQARDVRRLREWAGRGPDRTDPELAARAAAAPTAGAVTPKPAVPMPAAKPGAATAAGAAAKQGAPAVPATQPAPATAASQGKGAPTAAPGAAPATAQGATPATAAAGTATKPGTGPQPGAPAKPGQPGAPPTGAPAGAPPRLPRPGAPGGAPGKPPSIPPRQASQTRIIPPYGQTAEVRVPLRRRLLANPRYLVLTLVGVLVLGGGAAYGALQLTGEDEPAGPQAGGGGGDGSRERGRPLAPVDPSTVTVSVLNGTTVPGLAAQVGDEIERRGFQLGNVTNSPEQGARAESVVLFSAGNEREAIAVGRRLKISQREPINPESQALGGDATVVVVVGADQTQ